MANQFIKLVIFMSLLSSEPQRLNNVRLTDGFDCVKFAIVNVSPRFNVPCQSASGHLYVRHRILLTKNFPGLISST